MKIIGITGDSGVGKSTITLELSKKLNCPFLAIDKVILNKDFIKISSSDNRLTEQQAELLEEEFCREKYN